MSNVELIFDAHCPHVDAARQQLCQAFQELGQQPDWQEWDREAPSSPPHARQYGSPTILVDGKDVIGATPSDGVDLCRLYYSEQHGLQGVPAIDTIISALRNGARNHETGSPPAWLAVLPAIGIAMLPKLACPACWPVYAGLLSSIGLGFLTQTAYLFPFTVVFLIVAVGALGFCARNRHGFGPFVTGLAAALIVIVGKFQFDSDPTMYAGLALLIGASVWNSWPKQNAIASCLACVEAEDRQCDSTN